MTKEVLLGLVMFGAIAFLMIAQAALKKDKKNLIVSIAAVVLIVGFLVWGFATGNMDV